MTNSRKITGTCKQKCLPIMISNVTNNNNELWKTVIVTKFSKTTTAIFFNIFQLFHLKPSSNFWSCYFNVSRSLVAVPYVWILINFAIQLTQKTLNTWKTSGMLIVYLPITIKFRIHKQTSKPQINYRCCLRFSYLAPYWLISRNTITFHKYFQCSRFCEFHSNY